MTHIKPTIIPIAKGQGYNISVWKGSQALVDVEGIYALINNTEANCGRLTMTKRELSVFLKQLQKAQAEMRK